MLLTSLAFTQVLTGGRLLVAARAGGTCCWQEATCSPAQPAPPPSLGQPPTFSLALSPAKGALNLKHVSSVFYLIFSFYFLLML